MLPCVVLAGGLGTRMRPMTDLVPKALIPVLGRPFAERQLEWLAAEGVVDVIYSIGHLGDAVRAALGDGSRFNVRLTYVDEGEDLRGTGGALRLALDSGVLPEAFFVLNGDSFLSVKFAEVEAAWRSSNCPVLMTILHNQDRWDRSNVALLGEGRVLYDKRTAVLPSQTLEWIDYGLSVMSRSVVATAIAPEGSADLADAIAELSRQGQVAGYKVSKRFYEVGSPEGLRQLESRLRSQQA